MQGSLGCFTEFASFISVMKKASSVKLVGALAPEALQVLRGIPGLTVAIEPPSELTEEIVLSFGDSATPVAVRVRSRVNAATAWHLVREADAQPDTQVLLIAGETTRDARDILRQHGIGVIDGLGHAHIEFPGLLLHVDGGRPRQRAWPTRLNGKAGVAAQALLVQPERAWQVRDLAEEARVSMGLAHRVLARLAEEGVVTAEGSGRNRVRRITDPTALLDLWAEENTYQPSRAAAYLLAQSPGQLIDKLAAGLDRAGIGYALTGAAGATVVAPFVTTVPVAEVWVTAAASPEQLAAAVDAELVVDGQNVEFLQAKDDTPLAFNELVDGRHVANRFRLYADLRGSPRRGREQAGHLRQEVIGF